MSWLSVLHAIMYHAIICQPHREMDTTDYQWNIFKQKIYPASPQTSTSQLFQGQPGVFIKPDDYILGLGIRDVNKLLLCENFTWKCRTFLTDLALDFICIFLLRHRKHSSYLKQLDAFTFLSSKISILLKQQCIYLYCLSHMWVYNFIFNI